MSYEFAKREIGDYRITIYQDTDTTGVFLVVVAAKLTLKMQRMP